MSVQNLNAFDPFADAADPLAADDPEGRVTSTSAFSSEMGARL